MRNKKPDLHSNLEVMSNHAQNMNFAALLKSCNEIIEYYPKNAKILKYKLIALYNLGIFNEAEHIAQKSIALNPKDSMLYFIQAAADYQISAGNSSSEKGVIAINKAVALEPENPRYLDLQAQIYFKNQKLFLKVENICKKIIKYHPRYYDAYFFLYKFYCEKGDYHAAEDLYNKLVTEYFPIELIFSCSSFIPAQFSSVGEMEAFRKKFRDNLERIRNSNIKIKDLDNFVSNNCLYRLSYHGVNNKELLEELAATIRKIYPPLNYQADFITKHQMGGKIKIGFISSYFQENHPLMKCFQYIISYLSNSADFEVMILDIGNSAISNQALNNSKIKRMVLPTSFISIDLNLLQKISDQRCDILAFLDPAGHYGGYLLAFARLAPIQLCFTGQPITTGLDTMDYYISSDLWEAENAQEQYSEQLIRLKNPVISAIKPDIIDISYKRSDFSFPEDGNLYAIPAALQKIHPDFYGIIANILKKDPDARILLFKIGSSNYNFVQENLSSLLQKDIDKIYFLNPIEHHKFAYAMALCDVVLDPLYFGLHSSLYELFAHGIPIVTWPGELLSGRVAYGLYKWMGVSELTANNFSEYADIALKVATNQQYNTEIRQKIKENCYIIYGDTGAAEEVANILKRLATDGNS